LIESDRIINLKQATDCIQPYIELRNRYCELLLTDPVKVTETKEWLKQDDIEIRGVMRGNALVGIVILFLNRAGEIAFFSERKGLGHGSELLSIIEGVAKEKGLREVWAWVLRDNMIAQGAFLKNGYRREEETAKEYRGQTLKGFVFRKKLFRITKDE
jgi:ribosomal protein S18 acetylase RimI-like enzyme